MGRGEAVGPRTGGAAVAIVAALLGGVVGAFGVCALPRAPSAQELRAEWMESVLENARVFARVTEAQQARIEALERQVADLTSADHGNVALEELARFREAVRGELTQADEQIELLRNSIAEFAASAASLPVANGGEASDEEQRTLWAARSRSDDAGERFSALCFLGSERSDVGVAACLERIAEKGEAVPVVWKALRNLGRFHERSAAVEVARLLDHDEVVIRAAALEALTEMGAPDSGYDPTGPLEERTRTAAALRAWAREQR